MMQKILIIDDEPDTCLLLQRYLSRKGFEVKYATEALAGLEMLDTFLPDLVMSDFRLGKYDGSQILANIKDKFPHVPVIIMTGYSDIKIAVNVMKQGAFDYLTKPLFPEEIFLTIQRALAESVNMEKNEPEMPDSSSEPAKSVKPSTKKGSSKSGYIFGDSHISQQLVRQVQLVAPTNYSVIIYGESGSGKEAVAKEIHKLSKRAQMPFVAMDCGAISAQLAGSELFGHEKGAFTGALEKKIGHFELANGGTLFLDEVANLPYEVQVSLLRVVQERKLRRIGGSKEIDIDVRIVVASNEKLWDASRNGKFREDLYHRFNEFSIDVPLLRNRGKDIMLFAHYFLEQSNTELGKNVHDFAQDVERLFHTYPWYGNLREMKNVLKRATLLCDGNVIQMQHLPFEMVNHDKLLFSEKEALPVQQTPTISHYQPEPITHYIPTAPPLQVAPAPEPHASLKDAAMKAEAELILNALRETNFNKSKAADLLNIDRKTLYNKIKYYNL